MSSSNKTPPDYKVGPGKPPLHTRFRKGQSGNPAGRPRKVVSERLKALTLSEAYRAVTVKEGGGTVTLPAVQAVLRRQLALAVKGSVLAQRAVIATIAAIEKERVLADAAAAQRAATEAETAPMSEAEAIRRICFLLDTPERERQEKERLEEEAKARAALEAARARAGIARSSSDDVTAASSAFGEAAARGLK